MIKKTLYFGNPAYLSLRDCQLVVRLPEVEKNPDLPLSYKKKSVATFAVEDIGVVVLDHKQITITQGLLEHLLGNNVALITCNSQRMPTGLMLPLDGNVVQNERFRAQIEATEPLKKNLWQQTVKAKIMNQAEVLKRNRLCNTKNMGYWADSVKSGDPDNYEARAAAYYWSEAFPDIEDFRRTREGIPPNNLLNYGYAILRAIVARAIVGAGLLPTLGIFHSNRYNAYCLADDIMEPYRPFVDSLVFNIVDKHRDVSELTRDLKASLLTLPTLDVIINKRKSPLMIALEQTAASLRQCFEGKLRRIKYPTFQEI